MKGKHRIRLRDNRIAYEITVQRNITIIRGDSATGKTTLLEMLDTCLRLGNESGIYMECDVPVDVYLTDDRRKDWRKRLAEAEGSIVFIEEMNPFVKTKEFAEYVSNSASYFVLVTRWNLKNLPYSVKEIYKLMEKGKYPNTKQIYNSLEQYYSFENEIAVSPMDKVMTEDSGSGYEFYQLLCKQDDLKCESANGNSNMLKAMRQNVNNNVLYIADGAAFGAYMDECMQFLNYYGNGKNVLWIPESFEYLILKAGIIDIPDLANILENTSEYVNSEEYFSWERFYTSLLIGSTLNSEMVYSKSKLADYYKSDKIITKMEKVMPAFVRVIFKGRE